MVGPSGDFLLDSCMDVLFCKHLVNELNMFLVNAVAKKYDSTWINLNLGKDWLPFIRDTLTHILHSMCIQEMEIRNSFHHFMVIVIYGRQSFFPMVVVGTAEHKLERM